jgi:hypothetical protein
MSAFGSSLRGTICGVFADLLGGAVAAALGADTQPSTTPPVSVSYSPPGHSTVLGTTFVDWDSLTMRSTPVGQSRAVLLRA